MNSPEKLATQGTQDENKTITQQLNTPVKHLIIISCLFVKTPKSTMLIVFPTERYLQFYRHRILYYEQEHSKYLIGLVEITLAIKIRLDVAT